MGENPEVVKIACPGCETQFRLKPKKGRLPEGPVPCPKCGESIPIVEENIRRDGPKKSQSAPQAHAFGRTGDAPTKKKRGATITGSPADTPHRSDAVGVGDSGTEPAGVGDEADEFDHIAVAPALSNSNPKSTFLGMGSALQAVNGPGPGDDKTAVVDGDLLAKIRSESSVVEDDEEDADDAGQDADTTRDRGRNNTPEQRDVFARETSENKAVGPEELARAKEKEKQEEKTKRAQAKKAREKKSQDKEQDNKQDKKAPGQMVLGKIKIKKKLKRSLEKNKKNKKNKTNKTNKQQAGVRAPSKPAVSDDASSPSSKPSLSSLLKKARQKKEKFNLSQPEESASKAAPSADVSGEKLDRALDDLAKETARSIEEEEAQPASKPPAFDSGDSSMIELLRRRVAENQQPGAASERRGSGYIRLPTAEIQDVLGQGIYRLRVEDIVYEPIDKEGLTQLVKRGVLLGAEEIAEPDGDWMPIADHPVFLELRRKMAREAHDLLKKYKPGADDGKAPDGADLPGRKAELPGRKTELPGRKAELPAASDDAVDDIPEIEAELEEEAERAAKSLFADVDDEVDEADAKADSAPPLMPAQPDPAQPGPAQPGPAQPSADDSEDASIKLDYDALGVEEDDVEVEYDPPAPADETGSLSARGSSMRTWLPLVVAAAVVIVLGGLALTPFGRAYLEDVPYLDGVLGEQSAEPSNDSKAAVAADEDKDAENQDTEKQTAKVGEAVAQASEALGGALAVDPSDATLQQSVAEELAKAGDFAAAARVMGVLWQQRGDDADFAANFADVLMQAGHFARAREVAIDGLQMDTDAHDFAKVFARAVEENPALGAFDVVDVSTEMADAASVGTDGKRVVLTLSRDGAPAFRFKPSQSGWEDGWRTSIASYRLCQIMVCNFDIPNTRPARIDKATFDTLVEAGQVEAGQVEAGDAGDTSKLDWVSEDGEKYVYGALQDAVEDPARFPIEDTDIWRGWLVTGGESDMASIPATEALAGLKEQPGEFYEPLAAQLGQTSLEPLAAQLSSVLVFDFLTNNWSRFQSGDDKWGTHLHIADGQMISMHNGKAFRPRASTRIKGRFSWTSRFSKDTIASLRLMEPASVSEKLFPNATAGEKARLDVFWSQRDAVLERIDELESAHGAKEALAFE